MTGIDEAQIKEKQVRAMKRLTTQKKIKGMQVARLIVMDAYLQINGMPRYEANKYFFKLFDKYSRQLDINKPASPYNVPMSNFVVLNSFILNAYNYSAARLLKGRNGAAFIDLMMTDLLNGADPKQYSHNMFDLDDDPVDVVCRDAIIDGLRAVQTFNQLSKGIRKWMGDRRLDNLINIDSFSFYQKQMQDLDTKLAKARTQISKQTLQQAGRPSLLDPIDADKPKIKVAKADTVAHYLRLHFGIHSLVPMAETLEAIADGATAEP